jgi:Fe-Mn family superoxide dismutase
VHFAGGELRRVRWATVTVPAGPRICVRGWVALVCRLCLTKHHPVPAVCKAPPARNHNAPAGAGDASAPPFHSKSGATRRQQTNIEEIAVAFQLPDLPFARDALLPYMSPETFEYHHDKHHAAYVDNGNKLLASSGLEDKSLEEVIVAAFGKNTPLFNNAAQVYNHNLFWLGMKPNGGGRSLPGALAAKIDSDLGGFDKFRETFLDAAKTQFGSGWAWLSMKDGKLEVTKTSNAENPLVHGATPLLTADVWEHAYYVDYRNARPKYLDAWFDNLINWEFVEAQFEKAR